MLPAMRSRAPRRLRHRHQRGQLRAVVDETIALFHRLRWVAEQIYGEDGRSTTRRGLLRGLVRYGPRTVPALARTRQVTRQHVQTAVNALLAEGLVERCPNPRHARSSLIRATAAGQAFVRRLDEIDARVLVAAAGDLPENALRTTVQTLARMRAGFEDAERWQPAVHR
jgi:DNA-binding MarR family transcriptional regulator